MMIRRLGPDDFATCVPGLAELLVDAVEGGASLGFLAPLTPQAAAAWWREQSASVADGRLLVWVADTADGIAGTVSLTLEAKANAGHRASLIKLMVHRRARGRGLARRLLGTAERAAVGEGRTLLILDTETGSDADHLYRAAGWISFGIVPGYAADPRGNLLDCTFYYKDLTHT